MRRAEKICHCQMCRLKYCKTYFGILCIEHVTCELTIMQKKRESITLAPCETILIPESLCTLESWALGSGIKLKASSIPLTIGIRNPSSTDNESWIQYLKSRIHRVEPGIHSVEFGIQASLGFLYTGRIKGHDDVKRPNGRVHIAKRT